MFMLCNFLPSSSTCVRERLLFCFIYTILEFTRRMANFVGRFFKNILRNSLTLVWKIYGKSSLLALFVLKFAMLSNWYSPKPNKGKNFPTFHFINLTTWRILGQTAPTKKISHIFFKQASGNSGNGEKFVRDPGNWQHIFRIFRDPGNQTAKHIPCYREIGVILSGIREF